MPAHPNWPRFRIGINAGEALGSNIGSDEFRNFTAIGDSVNMAQRFQTLAQPGQVVTGPRTAAWIGDAATIEWLDEVHVKGKSEPVRPSVLGPTVRKQARVQLSESGHGTLDRRGNRLACCSVGMGEDNGLCPEGRTHMHHSQRRLDRSALRRAIITLGVTAALTLALAAPGAAQVRCTIIGTSGDDDLTGTPGPDVMCGMGGNDTFRGYGGNDVIRGGSGADRVYAASGNDKIYTYGGNDFIRGGAGDDLIKSGAGADTVYGGPGDDTIHGQIGNDHLYGQGGHDAIFGGVEFCQAAIDCRGSDKDTIRGGSSSDHLWGDGRSSSIGDDDDIRGAGVLNGGGGNDVMRGSIHNDQIQGDHGRDTIYGFRGGDDLVGGRGSDRLVGGRGSDYLYGGEWEGADGVRDRLIGGRGFDRGWLDAFDTSVSVEKKHPAQ